MYSEKFKDWAKSKGLLKELEGCRLESASLPLFWDAWQSAETAERERIKMAIEEISEDHRRDAYAEAEGMMMAAAAFDA
jgi:hypothetical protein